MGFWKGGGGGGGTPQYPIAEMDRINRRNVKATQTDARNYVNAVTRLSREARDAINKQASALGRDASAAEKTVLNRLAAVERTLNKQTGNNNAALRRNVGNALKEFNRAMQLVDSRDKAQFDRQVRSLRQEAARLDTTFAADIDSALGEFDTRSTSALSDFEATSQGLDDQFSARTAGALSEFDTRTSNLADEFQAATDQATLDYNALMDAAGDLSPERLAVFTQAADFLSNSAQQTRMNMLATADPRALELSAIADENAAAMMSGRVSADTQANLARSSAMRALQGGFGASSEMGRGLAARDLGLTALDLQQRGQQNYDAQRRLNFDTRVAGLQADASQLLANDQNRLVNQAGTLLETGLETARSNRDFLGNSASTILGGQLSTAESSRNFMGDVAGRVLGGELAIADTVRGTRVDTANRRFGERLTDARNIFGSSLDNLAARTARQAGVAQTGLTTRASTIEKIYDTNIGNARQQASTRSNLAGNIYSSRLATSANMRGMLADSARTYATDRMNAQANRFSTVTAARSAAASNMLQATQNNYAASLQRAGERNAGIGSLIGMGGSVIGGALGAIAGSVVPGVGTLAGAGIGSSLGGMGGAMAAGSLGYGGYAGGAQGANVGASMVGFVGGLSSMGNRQPSFSAPSGWSPSSGVDWFNYSK